ncbi:MAG: transketolase C-terminal domain-containing protein [Bdellovibrionales bacterium]
MNPHVAPLSLTSPLAGNPKSAPRHSIHLTRASGKNLQVADPRATRAMVALMDMQAQMNGAASHWGGPSAFAELMSTLHALMLDEAQAANLPWHQLFHFVNDAGHCENGLYALKANYGWAGVELSTLKKFRSIDGFLTGHGEAHMFPQGVYISNGPLGSGLPQAQGLAIGDALANRARVTVCAISDGGCMEGEAREALAAIPGLAKRGKVAPFVMVISDNNTKLTGRMDDSFSMAPTFESLNALGWRVIHLADGHNLEACLTVWEEALQMARQQPQRPVAIHAKTVKGFGVDKTVKSASGGHGFPLKEAKELKAFLNEIYCHEPYPAEFNAWAEELEQIEAAKAALKASSPVAASAPTEKVQVGVSKALLAKRAAGLPVVSVTSDLPGSTGLADFQKKYPEATIDVGVAEANMVSVAVGLSKEGFIPVVDTFSQFAVTKGNLPLIMAALSQGPVIGILSHVGFQDAADGASHQALSYFAATAAIPHTDIYALTSSLEAEALVGQAIDEFAAARKAGRTPRSKLFFLGRENFPRHYLPEGTKYKLGHAQVLAENVVEGQPAWTIVAAGALVDEALLAAKELGEKNISTIVINPSVINHPDVSTLSAALNRTGGNLLTVEDHQAVAGMGAMVVQALANAGVRLNRVTTLGVKDQFGQSAYSARELYRKHGLDSASIITAAR